MNFLQLFDVKVIYMPTVITGYNPEIYKISERQYVDVVGIVEPNTSLILPSDVPSFTEDEQIMEEVKFQYFINAIDDISRRELVDRFYIKNKKTPRSLIAGEICNSSIYGPGLTMQVNSVVTSCCKLGRSVKVNTSATVTHDAVIGDYTVIAPGAVILGNVKIGSRTYIGANSTSFPGVEIGTESIIGAGSVVRNHVDPKSIVAGVPARVVGHTG